MDFEANDPRHDFENNKNKNMSYNYYSELMDYSRHNDADYIKKNTNNNKNDSAMLNDFNYFVDYEDIGRYEGKRENNKENDSHVQYNNNPYSKINKQTMSSSKYKYYYNKEIKNVNNSDASFSEQINYNKQSNIKFYKDDSFNSKNLSVADENIKRNTLNSGGAKHALQNPNNSFHKTKQMKQQNADFNSNFDTESNLNKKYLRNKNSISEEFKDSNNDFLHSSEKHLSKISSQLFDTQNKSFKASHASTTISKLN